jgi:hypothetical protein
LPASVLGGLAPTAGFAPLRVAAALKVAAAVLAGVRPGESVVTTGSHALKSEMLKDRIAGED